MEQYGTIQRQEIEHSKVAGNVPQYRDNVDHQEQAHGTVGDTPGGGHVFHDSHQEYPNYNSYQDHDSAVYQQQFLYAYPNIYSDQTYQQPQQSIYYPSVPVYYPPLEQHQVQRQMQPEYLPEWQQGVYYRNYRTGETMWPYASGENPTIMDRNWNSHE